jgi:ribonuclease P protein component
MRFRPAEHIRRRADFERVYNTGGRVTGQFMIVFARPTPGSSPRLGIAATRKIGDAVVRNRAKRLVRELFRHHKPDLALDIVVVPRRELLDAPYPSLEREFNTLVERVSASAANGNVPTRGRRGRRPRAAPSI